MKNVKIIICVTLVTMLLCGCDKGASLNQTDPDQTRSQEIEAVSADSGEANYAIYEIDSKESEFNMSITGNVIDEAYDEEIGGVSTIGEMIQIEIKYISIWQNELDSSIAKYMDVLSDEDKNDFKKSQRAFDEYVQTSFDFESEILLQNKYNIHMGTSSNWLLYVERKDAIRERTIHIKYLHFLLERAINGEGAYTSLTFDSYEKDQ